MNQMTPDEAKASLGISTRLMGHLLPKAPQNPSDTPPVAPGQAEIPLRDKYAPEEKSSELGDIKEELKSLKTDILEAIKEDDNGEQGETKEPTQET